MKPGASSQQIEHIVERIEQLGLRSHIIVGTERTVVAALGEKRDGAKQALGAAFYALHKMGKRILGMRNPYWAAIPPLADMHGLTCSPNYDCYLAVSPNNPDGHVLDLQELTDDFHVAQDLGDRENVGAVAREQLIVTERIGCCIACCRLYRYSCY